MTRPQWADTVARWGEAASRCPRRVEEPSGCCGGSHFHCRGGRRDGQVVASIRACAECYAAHGPVPTNNAEPRPMREIYVAGYPGLVGGADTELLHMVRLWRRKGVDVHLVPTGAPNADVRRAMDALGCVTHAWSDRIFAGKVLVSFCNDVFLKKLPQIRAAGRPRLTAWANCMTWLFEGEKAAHRAGLIDRFIFQSDYQRGRIKAELEALGPVAELEGYRAYFDPADTLQGIRWSPRPDGYFGVGRASRADPAKFPAALWRTFDRVAAPAPKKVFVLGFEEKVKAKTGAPPETLSDWQWWGAGGVPVAELFGRIHVLLHQTGGSRENWPRVVLEAHAAGVAVVAERDYGLPEMIRDGETGFLVSSDEEAVYRASQLAFDAPLRSRMIAAAREHLLGDLAGEERCWEPWRRLLDPAG